ncbi:MAG: hypothetical protein KatS3mg111_0939 [Pirellulaceae bacterium]|nr:MAG: hypothetical protein KatS3mg111_0939 [Pirellulaceae bacterium]
MPEKVGLQDVPRQSNGEETRSLRSSADGLKHLARNQTPVCEPPTSPGPFTFFSAAEIARGQLVELLNQTFVGTLDCPALNELRTPEEFMDSFLHDRDLTDDLQWYVATVGEELAGCLFLTPLAEELMEITYLGLRPQFRQRGYGRYLVEHARNLATSRGAKMLLTAVDANNLPAVRIYRRGGFQVLQRMSVYLAGRVGQSRGYAWAM